MTVNTFETTNKTDEEAVVVTAEPVATSYVQQSSTTIPAANNSTTAGARAILCEAGVPRVDLGPTPVKITCGGCNHTGPSKTDGQIGTCAIIGIVVLVLFFWPLFWLPLVMNDVSVIIYLIIYFHFIIITLFPHLTQLLFVIILVCLV